jgi:hypothetical protein
VRNGKRYRYYVTQSQPEAPTRPWRLPAHEVEALVTTELAAFLADQNRLCAALDGWSPYPDVLQRVFQATEIIAEQLRGTSAQRRQALIELVSRIRLTASGLDVELKASALLEAAEDHSAASAHILVHVPTAFERRTGAMSIVVPGREVGKVADPSLIKAIARGHVWFEQLASGEAATIAEIARRENVTDRYVSSLPEARLRVAGARASGPRGTCATRALGEAAYARLRSAAALDRAGEGPPGRVARRQPRRRSGVHQWPSPRE